MTATRVPIITKKDIEHALDKYKSVHWYRKIPFFQSSGYQRLKAFYDELGKKEVQVPLEKMMDLAFILATKAYDMDTAGIHKHMLNEFSSLERKFGDLLPVLEFYTQDWRFVFKGISEDLPILYQYPKLAICIVLALNIVLDHYYTFLKKDLEDPLSQVRQIIYNHPKQTLAFMRLKQYRLYDKTYFDPQMSLRVELLFNLIDKANYVVEIMRMLRDEKILLSKKSLLIKQQSKFLNKSTIDMLEELVKIKLFSSCFDLLLSNTQYSDQILEKCRNGKYPITKESLEQIINDIKIAKEDDKVELPTFAKIDNHKFVIKSQKETKVELLGDVKFDDHKIKTQSQEDEKFELPRFVKFVNHKIITLTQKDEELGLAENIKIRHKI